MIWKYLYFDGEDGKTIKANPFEIPQQYLENIVQGLGKRGI